MAIQEPFVKSTLSVAQKIPTRLSAGLTTGVVVHSKVGPINPTLVSTPREFLQLYTENNAVTKGDHPSLHNAYFLSQVSDLVVARATSISYIPLKEVGIESSVKTAEVNQMSNGKIADRVQNVTLDWSASSDPTDLAFRWIEINRVLFYGRGRSKPFDNVGDNGLVGVDPSMYTEVEIPENLTLDSETRRIYDFIINWFSESPDHEDFILNVSSSDPSVLKVLSPKYTGDVLELSTDVITLRTAAPNRAMTRVSEVNSGLTSRFAIGYKNIGSVDTASAMISGVRDSEVPGYHDFDLKLIDKINGEVTYKCSTNPEAVNAQGDPIYFNYISETREDIIFIEYDPTVEVANDTVPTNMGKSIDYMSSVADYSKLLGSAAYAASSFLDYDESRIQLYTDAGWYNPRVAKALVNVASNKMGLTCVGIDPEEMDVNTIKNYGSAFTTWYSIVHNAGNKDTSVVGFQIPISPSCYYIEAISNNASRNSLYAPVFSKVNGPSTSTKLYKKFNKKQREILLGARVNTIVYDSVDGSSYFNNNLLSDRSGSLIDEDQSIRIINDIQYDVERLMENFISRFNTFTTRDKVETAITNYFETNILTQQYTIAGYKVVCDAGLNPDPVIQNNELRVEVSIKLNHSIKYITVVTKVVPTL